jgi:hypothetical protein
MKNLPLATIVAVALWIAYGTACGLLLFNAAAGIQRDLLLILGGLGVLTAIVTGALFLYDQRRAQAQAKRP